jgi:hypothetical protein
VKVNISGTVFLQTSLNGPKKIADCKLVQELSSSTLLESRETVDWTLGERKYRGKLTFKTAPTTATWNGRLQQKFVVQYRMNDPSAAELLWSDDHFVYFYPTEILTIFPRHIVFVIDVSGSMGGI